jgi:hypothetical protein
MEKCPSCSRTEVTKSGFRFVKSAGEGQPATQLQRWQCKFCRTTWSKPIVLPPVDATNPEGGDLGGLFK